MENHLKRDLRSWSVNHLPAVDDVLIITEPLFILSRARRVPWMMKNIMFHKIWYSIKMNFSNPLIKFSIGMLRNWDQCVKRVHWDALVHYQMQKYLYKCPTGLTEKDLHVCVCGRGINNRDIQLLEISCFVCL